ncbi:hypothetical protein C0989_010565 [Termitomyces sp. Mn162]|nr:hypothetical protein C0989_010565 [Termitomyces sp. Mn162]
MVQEVLDESLVKVCEAKEHLHLLLVLGFQLLCHTCYLHQIHLCGSVQDNQAKVLNPGLFKLALLQFKVELVLAEAFQNEASDLTMFLQRFSIDEDVVKVHTHYTLCYKVPEDVIHHGLKGGRAISESEEHNEQLKQSLVGLEGSLPLVSLLDAHVIVTLLDIQFSG